MYVAVSSVARLPDPIESVQKISIPAAALPGCPETPKHSDGDRFGADGDEEGAEKYQCCGECGELDDEG